MSNLYSANQDLFVGAGVRAFSKGQNVSPTNSYFSKWLDEGKITVPVTVEDPTEEPEIVDDSALEELEEVESWDSN
jgi:hypothetical protein